MGLADGARRNVEYKAFFAGGRIGGSEPQHGRRRSLPSRRPTAPQSVVFPDHGPVGVSNRDVVRPAPVAIPELESVVGWVDGTVVRGEPAPKPLGLSALVAEASVGLCRVQPSFIFPVHIRGLPGINPIHAPSTPFFPGLPGQPREVLPWLSTGVAGVSGSDKTV